MATLRYRTCDEGFDPLALHPAQAQIDHHQGDGSLRGSSTDARMHTGAQAERDAGQQDLCHYRIDDRDGRSPRSAGR